MESRMPQVDCALKDVRLGHWAARHFGKSSAQAWVVDKSKVGSEVYRGGGNVSISGQEVGHVLTHPGR